ncbi:MAG TPA: head GIN domain-containing protein [Planctomycetota bacterium]|nr:head GIN domain-containing protein [Planctomycetota bacterium]
MSKRARVSLSLSFVLAPLAACVASIGDTSCSLNTVYGSGVAATESRSVPDFSAVEVRGSADVVARVGGGTSLELVGDDNLLQYVTTEVEDGKLVISMQPGSYDFDVDLVVTLSTPRLESLAVMGSSDSEISGLSGGDLALSIAGSGEVRARGSVDSLRVSIRGSGDMLLEELEASAASVSIAGSGDVRLFARESLDVGISGSGDVRYLGKPKVSRSIAGSGNVSRL